MKHWQPLKLPRPRRSQTRPPRAPFADAERGQRAEVDVGGRRAAGGGVEVATDQGGGRWQLGCRSGQDGERMPYGGRKWPTPDYLTRSSAVRAPLPARQGLI